MPRVVDHTARRTEIAEAAWRVLEREGAPGANLREIAAEAGYTTGVLTHYFRDKRALMAFVFELVTERSTARMPAAAATAGPVGALAELLPLDERRCRETTVWLALTSASLADPALATELRRRYQQARDAIRPMLAEMLDSGAQTSDPEQPTDPADLIDELLAIVDGITVDALADPDRYPPARQLALLRRAAARLGLAPHRSDSPPGVESHREH